MNLYKHVLSFVGAAERRFDWHAYIDFTLHAFNGIIVTLWFGRTTREVPLRGLL